MDKDKQRIALAELDWWVRVGNTDNGGEVVSTTWERGLLSAFVHQLPPYERSLAELRRIELAKKVYGSEHEYLIHLMTACQKHDSHIATGTYMERCIFASAQARAEALLRTFGKWEEEE